MSANAGLDGYTEIPRLDLQQRRDRLRCYNFAMVDGLFFITGLFLYFLPSMIAAKKRKAAGIITLNLLLGWSVIGWIVWFVWALAAEKEKLEVPALEAVQLSP